MMDLVNSLSTWKYRLRERYLKLFPVPATRFPLSWEINPEEAKNLVLRWPVRYGGESADHWLRHLKSGFRRHVRIETKHIPQPYRNIVVLELFREGKTHPIAIDYADYMDRIESECVDRSAAYFKMQYRREGYSSPCVLPGGYVNLFDGYYKHIPWLRTLAGRRHATFEVYGRFGLASAQEIRRRAVAMLASQDRFHFEGSLGTVRCSRSLEEAARARICIDLPGNGDFCFRLIDYLGIGACIVGPRQRTMLHVPLEDRKHIVYAREDLSDLVDLCQYYLEHEAERSQLVRNSREFFDRYLHRDQLAAYYLYKSLEKIKSR
jgi:Glycosyl transferases group 1